MKDKLLFYLVVKPISYLPFWVLYGMSNVVAFVFCYVIKYRGKVIDSNLKNSFPNKSEKEIKVIKRKFYSHFSDLLFESLKLFSISEKQIKKRMQTSNGEIFDKYFENGQNVVATSGHFGNWEMWSSGGNYHSKHQMKGVYKPLKNKYWEETAKKSRGKFGMGLVPTHEAADQFKSEGEPIALALLLDQSPARTKKCYWTTFLNQDTAVNFGAENLSKKFNTPVVYGNIQKVKRGHFVVDWKVITEKPLEEEYGFITESVTKELEKHILAYPHLWLWSHKRWKRTRTPGEELRNVIPVNE